ncbi:branched-chain-amino-acid aminotransferase, cytosolic [Tamandua tetradactyla]|uniref:branched-chain-amino-acid aminotransferase, cytosolic n=1 Tax=Tamandua tetradactyla TaxID=48850 RepID=UPI004054571E
MLEGACRFPRLALAAQPRRVTQRASRAVFSCALRAALRSRSLSTASPPAAVAVPARQDCNHGCSAGCTGEERAKEVMEAFKAKDLIITPATILKEKPDPSTLTFGSVFTDHMLTVEWSLEFGWEKPHIKPLQNLSLHPGSSAFHYAVELFEGLKAFRGVDNKIRLFRPNLNMDRMYRSALRTTLPVFDKEELLECIQQLVKLDQEWVPYSTSASLYIRPTFIGTEPSLGVKMPSKALLFVILCPVGPYFSSGSFNPVSLWANPKYVRAWKGGTGDCKMGGNYGSSLFAQREALENGCQQVLWLYGENKQITEIGTMNLFLYWINEDGEEELATPPLDGIILPGVTRQSILDLVRTWGEFKVSERYLTMDDLTAALEGNRVREMFGSGTACVVCPVSKVLYEGETIHIPTMENGPKLASRILNKLTDIQHGRQELCLLSHHTGIKRRKEGYLRGPNDSHDAASILEMEAYGAYTEALVCSHQGSASFVCCVDDVSGSGGLAL